ncbi:MAG TPA: hypothetical protein VKN18_17870 [Blastocatellia bacterium]|nr:hypothetical protein [Blastocatellia bacterium]
MLVSTQMITGFNTDVRHEGHVYHVQTEDRGKDNPILESLVYVGGTIVAKKLTPYPAPLSKDAGPDAVASMLKRQHQVIIAAIKAGRIDDLIRHSGRQQTEEESLSSTNVEPLAKPEHLPIVGNLDLSGLEEALDSSPVDSLAGEVEARDEPAPTPTPPLSVPTKSSKTSGKSSDAVKSLPRTSSARGDTTGLNLDEVLEDYAKRGSGQAKLDVKVLTPDVFVAGRGIALRIQVANGVKPDLDATVTVKIIGTAFKPQVFIGRVGRDGVANFSITLPSFSTGTAAIVIEAQSSKGRGELKNLIRRT